jgi:site-specific recombinase XerD
MLKSPSDSLREWMADYVRMAVEGIRSEEVCRRIQLHLDRFQSFFEERYGQEHLSSCVKRDVLAWRNQLEAKGLAASTINSHLASLSGFATWVLGCRAKIVVCL